MERDLPAVAVARLEPIEESLGPLREPEPRVTDAKFRTVRMSFHDRARLDRRVEWVATWVGTLLAAALLIASVPWVDPLLNRFNAAVFGGLWTHH